MSSSTTDLEKLIETLALHAPFKDPVLEGYRTGLVSRYHLLADHPANIETFEREHNPEGRYTTRLQILSDAKLTRDFTGKPIEFPPYSDLRNDLLSHPELSLKLKQGFTDLQPLPFGAPFEAYLAALEKALTTYNKMQRTKHKGLRATDGTPLHLSTTEKPLWIFDPYRTADTDGSLVYHPKEYHSDLTHHQGKTKAELLAEDPTNAAQTHLVEPLRDIPRRGHGQTIGSRPQLEAGAEAHQYLAQIGKAPYDQEQGFTPELELTCILTHLHETDGEVLDGYQSGSACYCPAGWFPSLGFVPDVYFFHEFGRLRVARYSPGNQRSDVGARSAVRVKKP